jgi:hypothetical protein
MARMTATAIALRRNLTVSLKAFLICLSILDPLHLDLRGLRKPKPPHKTTVPESSRCMEAGESKPIIDNIDTIAIVATMFLWYILLLGLYV